jgi:predicted alpha/beta hydrolase family esterase
MKTLILPGYSLHNKDWAEEIASQLKTLNQKIQVHNWKHWTEGSFSVKSELERILEEIKNEKVNILAKSVGVYVALKLIPQIPSQVNKVILCGIASVVAEDRKALVETALSKIPLQNILCIQNEFDKYVKYADAEMFYHSVEPKLVVLSKPRSDHDYPYPEDFKNFLE